MARSIQIVVDTQAAHELADWWAETLNWVVEPTDEAFIRRMLDEGFASDSDTEEHRGQIVWRGAAAITPGDVGDGPSRQRILFQDVPEAKNVKNRLHIDVRMPEVPLGQARDALLARGATYLESGSQGPHHWHVMADPEGNEFCVSG